MKIGVVVLGAIMVSGCATVFRGSSEDISFTSSPTGGEVRLSTGQFCVTPCTIDVSRKGPLTVTIDLDGYKEYRTAMPATIDGAAVAGYTTFNVVMLPIVNDVVDYNTRANFSRKPNPLHVELIPLNSDGDYVPLPVEQTQGEEDVASSEGVPQGDEASDGAEDMVAEAPVETEAGTVDSIEEASTGDKDLSAGE